MNRRITGGTKNTEVIYLKDLYSCPSLLKTILGESQCFGTRRRSKLCGSWHVGVDTYISVKKVGSRGRKRLQKAINTGPSSSPSSIKVTHPHVVLQYWDLHADLKVRPTKREINPRPRSIYVPHSLHCFLHVHRILRWEGEAVRVRAEEAKILVCFSRTPYAVPQGLPAVRHRLQRLAPAREWWWTIRKPSPPPLQGIRIKERLR